MFCISMYSESINTKLHLDLRASINLQIEHFFIMVIYVYRISVCFVFPSNVKVSTRNYTWT